MTNDHLSDASEARRNSIVSAYPLDNPDLHHRLSRLAALAARLCSCPMAMITIVTIDRQVFVGSFGIGITETPRQASFCAVAMNDVRGLIVADASRDPRFSENPLVTGDPNIRFYAGHPLVTSEGIPLGAICAVDTCPRTGLSAEQADSLATLGVAAMALLERWRSDESARSLENTSRRKIVELEQRFQVLGDALPQMVWSTRLDGMADYFNKRWCEYTGYEESRSFDARWMDFLHPDDVALAGDVWGAAVASGGDYEVRYRLKRHDGVYRWVLARGLPILNQEGEVTRWIGTCTDIHEEVQTSEQLEMLSQELTHRIKNIFAVITGLISLSSRRHPEFATLTDDLQGRVIALGRAHDFVNPRSATLALDQTRGSLKTLLGSLLSPYSEGDDGRILLAGDDQEIDDRSATPLALFIHELATNSAKYGALGCLEGRITIEIEEIDSAVAMRWKERGGPPVIEPPERGFGHLLAQMSIVRQLSGNLEYNWSAEGLEIEAIVPRTSLSRS